jgi:hypothetical protein
MTAVADWPFRLYVMVEVPAFFPLISMQIGSITLMVATPVLLDFHSVAGCLWRSSG